MKKFLNKLNDNYTVIIKTITYRIVGGGSTFLLAFLLTNKASHAGIFAILSFLVHLVIYWSHEKTWRWAECKYRNKPF